MTAYPVSAKGVLVTDNRVLLARNHRGEWELPGGRPDRGESLRAAVEREMLEETGLVVVAGACLDAWIFEVVPGQEVVIAAFVCQVVGEGATTIVASDEHTDVMFQPLSSLPTLDLPAGYRRAIDLVGTTSFRAS